MVQRSEDFEKQLLLEKEKIREDRKDQPKKGAAQREKVKGQPHNDAA